MRKLITFIFIIFLFSACTVAQTEPTATLSPTDTPTLPAATFTPTYTTTPTNTPEPTPFPAKEFAAEIVGFGEHGAMIEIEYQGNWVELSQFDLVVTLKQANIIVENQPVEEYDGRYLAEMTDAFYDLGDISAILNISDETNNTSIELNIVYDQIFPWMSYLYGSSDLATQFSYPWSSYHLDAWDIQPTSKESPNGDGHPVFSPCTGVILKAEIIPESVSAGNDDTHDMMILCRYTGYMVQLGHTSHEDYVSWGEEVNTESVVGILHWEKVVSRPHNHFSVWRPNKSLYEEHLRYIESGNWLYDRCVICNQSAIVDPFNPQLFLDSNELEFGFWLGETLPDQVKALFKSGIFDWPEE